MSTSSPEIEQLPVAANEVLVSVNPKAGAKSGRPIVASLVERLRELHFSVSVTSDIEELAAQAAEKLAAGRLRAVVSAGGDGTAALIANRTPTNTPIAILPLGTENLLAKFLGIRTDMDAVASVIADGCVAHLDAGQANGRLFLLMVGCGFDAEVVRRLHEHRKGNIHHLSYVKPILDSIRSYGYPELRIVAERVETPDADETPQQPVAEPLLAKWVFVVNLPRYAGGLQIVPAASGTDGLLDVCTFKEGSLWNGLMYLSGILLGQHQNWSDCVQFRTRRLRIEPTTDAAVPYQLDGDPGGFLPVEIELLPRRLTVLAPRAWWEK